MSSTQNLLDDHFIVRRLASIAKKCSNGLYSNLNIPIEDIQIISVVIEEFVDAFHHGKEENAYFPVTKYKNSFSEDIRKFLIEHELGRRIAKMLRRELDSLIDHDRYDKYEGLKLQAYNWEVRPLEVQNVHSSFYENENIFPKGSVQFDNALLMTRVEHEWKSMKDKTVESKAVL